jgi:hypothetical protein
MSAESAFSMVAAFVRAWKRTSPDAITLQEPRFSEMKKLLPMRGEVGYASDLDPRTVQGIAARGIAQYVLAPVRIASGQELVVYNSFSGITRSDSIAASHFVIVKDFGRGLMLLRRQEK